MFERAVKESIRTKCTGNATKTNKLNVSYKFREIPSYIKLEERSIHMYTMSDELVFPVRKGTTEALKHYMNEI